MVKEYINASVNDLTTYILNVSTNISKDVSLIKYNLYNTSTDVSKLIDNVYDISTDVSVIN